MSPTAVRRLTRMSLATGSDYDAIVIGSGIGGLSSGAVLAAAGKKVLVCEAHSEIGGAMHSFRRSGFEFESGPSLYAGLSSTASPNPLKHVFQIVGEEPTWIQYDSWGTSLPGCDNFAAAVGSSDFVDRILPKYGGPNAVEEWNRLMDTISPLGKAIFGVPTAAVREDAFAGLTLARYGTQLGKLLSYGPTTLNRPFQELLQEVGVRDEFVTNWLNMICFLLQGTTLNEAPTTLMAYMLSDFYMPGAVLDYPKGGSVEIARALARGVTKHGGHVATRTRVGRVVVEKNRVQGVILEGKNNVVIRAPIVISNADPWTTAKTLCPELKVDRELTPCPSFLHLHLGIEARESDDRIPPQWAALTDWNVSKPKNLALVSVASKLDPSLAPPGRHVVHAYTPATENFEHWLHVEGYEKAKADACQVLWRAIEKYIPDVRERVLISLEGTPLTHRKFLNRYKGTYGAFVRAPDQLGGHRTSIRGFWLCGDCTFPGIGVPAAAASGLITANSILSPLDHWRLLDRIKIS